MNRYLGAQLKKLTSVTGLPSAFPEDAVSAAPRLRLGEQSVLGRENRNVAALELFRDPALVSPGCWAAIPEVLFRR